jgi:ADP-ribose pyrophosphatase YjhB (NUDIX family)
MAIADYIARIREKVGHELLVLPSVAVIPRDDRGRVLLVKDIDTGLWAAIGGAVEPDESPAEAGVREAKEEAGVNVQLGPLLGVLGGPQFRITYPNGDQTSYVSTVFEARVVDGVARPDGEETSAATWWAVQELPYAEMSDFTRALLFAIGLGSRYRDDALPGDAIEARG